MLCETTAKYYEVLPWFEKWFAVKNLFNGVKDCYCVGENLNFGSEKEYKETVELFGGFLQGDFKVTCFDTEEQAEYFVEEVLMPKLIMNVLSETHQEKSEWETMVE